MSPGVNDPMTAVTCIGYLRSILVRLTERCAPAGVRHLERHEPTVILRRRRYDEYVEGLLQIGRAATERDRATIARELAAVESAAGA